MASLRFVRALTGRYMTVQEIHGEIKTKAEPWKISGLLARSSSRLWDKVE
jgi:hypothetical protein